MCHCKIQDTIITAIKDQLVCRLQNKHTCWCSLKDRKVVTRWLVSLNIHILGFPLHNQWMQRCFFDCWNLNQYKGFTVITDTVTSYLLTLHVNRMTKNRLKRLQILYKQQLVLMLKLRLILCPAEKQEAIFTINSCLTFNCF